QNEAIKKIADKHKKTVSQIILRWHYHPRAIPIPKSGSPERQLANITIFDLSLNDTEISTIAALTPPNDSNTDQGPAAYEEFSKEPSAPTLYAGDVLGYLTLS